MYHSWTRLSRAKKGGESHSNMHYKATIIKQFNIDKGLGR